MIYKIRIKCLTYLDKLELTITSEQKVNEEELKGVSGVYIFQHLSNNNPVFLRKDDVRYRYGTGYSDYDIVSYSLSYRDGQWRVRRNESNKSDWSDAETIIRRETECLYFLYFFYQVDFNIILHYRC